MAESTYSRGVQYAWQIAAEEAIRAGASEIEPVHLLLGVLGLEKLIAEPNSAGVSAADVESICSELQILRQGLPKGTELGRLRKGLRAALPNGSLPSKLTKVSRSPAARQVFADASVNVPAGHTVSLVRFSVALSEALTDRWRSACADLGLDLGEAGAVWRPLALRPVSPLPPSSGQQRSGSETEVRLPVEVEALDASVATRDAFARHHDAAPRLAGFIELLWEQPPGRDLDDYLQRFLEGLLATIPSTGRGAILIPDQSHRLLLRAHVPLGSPSVSFTSAQRAMQEKRGIIWQVGDDLTHSQQQSSARSGMYAPLVWNSVVYGVVCVDNHSTGADFRASDLTFLVAAAHHLALTVAYQQLNSDLERNSEVLQRLLSNFSPKLRTTLLEKARRGRLRLGGESSEVTILFCDLRGFTRVSAAMSGEDIMDMLNEYFHVLTDTIFKYEGTVDKYIGDAVLAVFGSPEPDPEQYTHALQCAAEMQERVREVNVARANRKLPVCEMGVALHCGKVLHGFVGTSERMEFTVIGDAVNRTSRYCGGAVAGEIVLSPEFYKRVWNTVDAAQISVPSKHEGHLPGYRLIAVRSAEAGRTTRDTF
jgi:adenylate cyclase